MRKTLLALALAATLPAAFAQGAPTQPGIEIYGIVDMGVERIDNGTGAKSTRLTSGVSTGSRLGIRGNEDLGGGFKALFVLENRLEADTGQVTNRSPVFFCGTTCPGVTVVPPATALPAANQAAILGGNNLVNSALLSAVSTVNSVNALFDRQAWVGLVTPVGAALLGRQYTAGYEVLVKFNSFDDSLAGNPGHIGSMNIRANNMIQYRAELKGFTVSLQYGFGGAEGTAGGRSERTTGPGKGDDFFGANLQYVTPNFSLGGAYQQNRTVTFAQPNKNQQGLRTYNFGGTATVGPVKLFAQYVNAKNDHPVLEPADIQGLVISTGGNATAINAVLGSLFINRFDVDALRGVVGPTDLDLYHVGFQWTIGNGMLRGAFNHSKDTARSPWATGNASVDQYGVAYFYNLSRRSALYTGYAYANNKGQARIALGAACCVGGWTTAQGKDSSNFQTGIRHIF